MTTVQLVTNAALVLIVLIGVIGGVKNGFAKTIAKPVRIVAALWCAAVLCTSIGPTYIQPKIQAPVRDQISSYLTEKCSDLTAENIGEELPTLLKAAAGIVGVDVETLAQNAGEMIVERIVDSVLEPVTRFLSSALAFVLLYAGLSLIFALLLWIFGFLFNAGPLLIINKLLGFAFGGAFSIILAWLLVLATDYVIGFAFADAAWAAEIRGAYLYQLLYRFNLMDFLLSF